MVAALIVMSLTATPSYRTCLATAMGYRTSPTRKVAHALDLSARRAKDVIGKRALHRTAQIVTTAGDGNKGGSQIERFNTILNRIQRFMFADLAIASAEYAVGLALLATAIIGVVHVVGPSVQSLHASVSKSLADTVWVASGTGPNDQLPSTSITRD